MLSRFHLIPERDGQTDRQTDGQTDRIAISVSRVSVLTCDKNQSMRLTSDVDAGISNRYNITVGIKTCVEKIQVARAP